MRPSGLLILIGIDSIFTIEQVAVGLADTSLSVRREILQPCRFRNCSASFTLALFQGLFIKLSDAAMHLLADGS